MVFTTPAIAALRARYPAADIAYLVEPAAAPVVQHNPHLTRVLTPERPRGWARVRYDIALARRLRRERFDVEVGKIIAGALRTRGLVAVRLGRFDEGRVLHEEALALFRSLGDLFWIALSLLNLSASVQDDMGRRVALQQEALALFRDQGSPWGTARALTELGRTAISLRDLSGGIAYVREALALAPPGLVPARAELAAAAEIGLHRGAAALQPELAES